MRFILPCGGASCGRRVGQFQKKDISAKQLAALEDLLRKESGKQLDFPEGLRAENRYGTLVLPEQQMRQEFCYALPMGGGNLPFPKQALLFWSLWMKKS